MEQSYIYKYWFPENFDGDLYIVCPKDASPTKDASLFAEQYAFLDNFDDKDLLLLIYGFVSKYYPMAHIHYTYSNQYIKNFPTDWAQKNLIILGGLSWGHEVARRFMLHGLKKVYKNSANIDMPPVFYAIKNTQDGWKSIRRKICATRCKRFDEECDCRVNHSLCVWKTSTQVEPETMVVKTGSVIISEDEIRRLEKDDILKQEIDSRITMDASGQKWVNGCVVEDVGVFAAFQNPFDDIHDEYSKTRVIMISGAHTFGGVGAFRTFNVENNTAKNNYRELDKFLEGNGNDFIAYFPVEIDEAARTCNQCAELKAEKNFISLVTPKQQEALSSEAVEDLEALKEDIAQLDKALQRYIKAKTQLTGEAKNLHESKRVKAERLYEKVASIQTALDEIKTQSEFDLKFNALKVEFEAVRTEWHKK